MLLANEVHATRAFICEPAAGVNHKPKIIQRMNQLILLCAIVFIPTT